MYIVSCILFTYIVYAKQQQVITLLQDLNNNNDNSPIYTNKWVIHIKGGHNIAKRLAENNNFIFHGQLGSLQDYYYLEHKHIEKRSRRSADKQHVEVLNNHPDVRWLQQQKVLSRRKRGYITDPLFKLQWYLQNQGQTSKICQKYVGFESLDIDVKSCWDKNITGEGVVVSILDDGLEHKHPDLMRNYDWKASFDFNDMDKDPYPMYTNDNVNKHGTRCAGEVAAEINNGICGAGVAYNAKVGGIRMLDGDVTDGVEAASLSFNPQHIDIYSSSWGPDDFGKTVDGPSVLAQKAFETGITHGRKGRGSIFVWATGNGGHYKDHCSCDGYINSPYTISVGAVDNCGQKPWYVEQCPGTLAVTYSSGESQDLQIATTDLHFKCTTKHTGTSAAAPLAAGIFALVLQANPKLTWRDLQHLIVKTSKIVSPDHPGWRVTSAGYKVNSNFGFGALDAGALVKLAQSSDWKTSRPQHICTTTVKNVNLKLKKGRGTIRTSIKTNACATEKQKCITKLEHVQLIVTIDKKLNRGQLEIDLIAPTGTKSDILRRRTQDVEFQKFGFRNWHFLTVFHWDENPVGEWIVAIKDHSYTSTTLVSWHLKFYGTRDPDAKTSQEVTRRLIDDKSLCESVCEQGCPKDLSQHCFECDHFCDCTIGACVPVCDENLVANDDLRHCEKNMRFSDYPYIPSNTYNQKRTASKKSTFGNISLPVKFVIICVSLLFVTCLIGGIVYMTSKMPKSNNKTLSVESKVEFSEQESDVFATTDELHHNDVILTDIEYKQEIHITGADISV